MLNGGYSQVKMSRFLNSRAARPAEIPAGKGIGNARSLAKMYAATIGEIEGARLLKRDGVNRAWTLQTDGLSQREPFSRLPMKYPLRFALGYELGRTGSPMLGKGSFGHSGRDGIWRTHILKAVLRWAMIATTWHGYLAGPDARWLPWTKALHQAIARKTSRAKTESVAGH